jgi:hypothetical protein
MPAWLKAGLIGAVILIVLSLIGMIPFALLGCLVLPLYLVVYVAVGVLAASYMPPPRTAGAGAGQGALAAAVAALLSGVVSTIIGAGRAAMTDATVAFQNIPPDMLDQIEQTGVPMEVFVGLGGALIFGTICCTVGILLAAALGAIGGAIYGSSRSA